MNIPILLYHSISRVAPPRFNRWVLHPDDFTAQMVLLSRLGYTPIPASNLASALIDRSQVLPEHPVLITFDDGLADFYTNALPVLARYHFPATLYVATAFVDSTSRWMSVAGVPQFPMLTWAQIAEVAAFNVEIGSHGHNHLQLDTLSIPKAMEEIVRSQAILEAHLGARVVSFAYPHGYSSPEVRQLLPQVGFSSAVSVKNAMSSLEDDRFELARIVITPAVSLDRFSSLLKGIGLRTAPYKESLKTRAWRLVRRSYFQVKEHILVRDA